jgi:hypothetical protein
MAVMSYQLDGAPRTPSLVGEALLTVGAGLVAVLFSLSLLLLNRGYYWTDDFQTYQLAGYCEVARAWSEGEPPLLSRCSWWSGALAAEFQNGVFSVFLTSCNLLLFRSGLSLPLIAASLSTIHLAILAMGCFRLGRGRGLSPDLAYLVAFVGALSGWIFLWGGTMWFPALASFAWLPWMWWALEWADEEWHGWARFIPAGVFLYLIIAAGWPFTVLMAAIISAWLARRIGGERRQLLPLWPIAAAWAVGLALSAPAWLMLLEYTPYTVRGQTPLWVKWHFWTVPVDSMLGLAFPCYGTLWDMFGFYKPHLSFEMAGGLVPVAILAALLWRTRWAVLKALHWEWALLALLFILCTGPSLGNFQYSFRWLPLFSLVLGLLAAEGIQWQRAENAEGKVPLPNFATWAVGLVLGVWLWSWRLGLDPTPTTRLLGLGFVFLCYAWSVVETRCGERSLLRRAMPCLVTLLGCWLTYALFPPHREVPTWEFTERVREVSPLDPSVRYLSVHGDKDHWVINEKATIGRIHGIGEELYPGNAAMYSGLEFVNGYSPLGPLGLEGAFGFLTHGFSSPEGADRVLTVESGRGGFLDLLGVDGLVLADGYHEYLGRLKSNGWSEEGTVKGGIVLRRLGTPTPRVRAVEQAEALPNREDMFRRLREHGQGPAPILLLAEKGESEMLMFAPAEVTLVGETRNSTTVEVKPTRADGDMLIVFSRCWFPGYQAVCNGQTFPVEFCSATLPAVRLPAGTSGRLVLSYQPPSLILGEKLALAAIAFVGVALLLEVARRVISKQGFFGGRVEASGRFTRCITPTDQTDNRLWDTIPIVIQSKG